MYIRFARKEKRKRKCANILLQDVIEDLFAKKEKKKCI